MKELFVHIGTPKTATTSIQSFCYDNREILAQKGICYPVLPFSYPGKLKNRNGLFLEGVIWKDGERDHAEEARRLRAGFALVEDCFRQYDRVVISDEAIWMTAFNRRGSVWQELREEGERVGYTVKIILYLRRQDEFVESWWNQRIKSDQTVYSTMTWEQFLEKDAADAFPDYYQKIKKIAAELGRENILIRRFDRKEFYGGSIQADFLHLLGLELTDELALEEERKNLNTRLLGNTLEVKRIVNGIPNLTREENLFFRESAVICTPLSGAEYPCHTWSAEEARAYVQRFAADNQRLAEEYIGDGRPMFRDSYPERMKWTKDNPYLADDIIRFSAVSDLQLLRELTACQERITELEKQVREQEKALNQERKERERAFRRLKHSLKHPLRTLVRMLRRRLRPSSH